MSRRVALIGCGAWGRNIARNLADLGALAAVCDTDTAAAEAAAHGAPVRDVDDVLADPAIDAVAIATPAATHAALAAVALAAGKHVFVEQPLALDVAEAEQLVTQAATTRRVLMVGHLMRHHPAFAALLDLVRAGTLGPPSYIHARRLNLGRIRREEDILWSFAPHDVSMILAVAGTFPERVTAQGVAVLNPEVADVTTTQLAFPGGLRAEIHVSWLNPFKEQRLVVVGERGMAVLDDGQDWNRKLVRYPHRIAWQGGLPVAEPASGEPVALTPAEPLAVELRHFLDCIATGAAPLTDGAEGLAVLRVLAAASAALRPRPGIHPSVEIAPDATVGAGTRIWHHSRVLAGSRIGTGCRIGQNVVIGPRAAVGERCKVQNNVSLYQGVTLEDEVFVGPAAVFTNVRTPRAAIDRRAEFAPTLVRRGATVGANATILCGITIGEYAFVAAGAVVTRDVAPFALVAGNPAARIGWVGHAGERLVSAPSGTYTCPRTGRRYVESAPETLTEIG
jgi:predicted dehydrogenase/acetyltransferase-like isoleucine patch superfamily enzyme